MKQIYITDLANGMELTHEPFMLQEINRRETRDGRPFLLATIRDKSGHMNGVFWDLPPDVDTWLRPGAIARLTGRVNLYKDALQISITELQEASGEDVSEFLSSSARPQAEMRQELRQQIGLLAGPWEELTRRLLLEGDLAEPYAFAPAARVMHHAYIGGLLEHSLSMAALARHIAAHYHHVDADLLVTGALLHDLGKALEYSLEDGFASTEDGRLVGHIVRTIVLVEQAAADLDVDEDDLRQLVHLIASHHGTQEWGSPVIPKTIEAVLLHQLDMMDSRAAGFFDHLRSDNGNAAWTARRSAMFGTDLRRPSGFRDN